MANSPQVPQPDDGLEVYHHSPSVNSPMLPGTTPHTSYQWELSADVPELKRESERTSPEHGQAWVRGGYIALQWRTFWCIVVLSLFILAAAIGGGIGGGLAIQKAKSQGNESAKAAVTVTVTTTSIRSATVSTDSAPSRTSSSETSLYTVLAPSAVPRIDNSCPSSNSLASYNDEIFNCYPNHELREGWITGIVAYNMQACIDACTTRNVIGGSKNEDCVAVQLGANLSFEAGANNGANCWLSSGWSGEGGLVKNSNWTTAQLCKGTAC